MKLELQETIENLGKAFDGFKAEYNGRLDHMEIVLARGGSGGGTFYANGSTPNANAREHSIAFSAWARSGDDFGRLKSLELKASMHTESDPDGGFLVPVEMDKAIEKLALAGVAMRRLANVIVRKGDYQKPISKGGTGGGWTTERGARNETAGPELALFCPAWCELYANPAVTQKLLDQSDFDLEGFMLEYIMDTFNTYEGTGFISGNGVGQPKGILAYDMIANGSYTWGKVGYIASGHATLLNDCDKLIDLQHALKAVYRQGASWLMNDATFAKIRKLKDGEGNYIWRQGLEAGAADTLLGKPVEIDDNMPDIGAGTYPVAFGDFKRAYLIVDNARGVRVLRDPFTNKPYVNFYTTKRVTGGISNYEAIKFLKIAA